MLKKLYFKIGGIVHSTYANSILAFLFFIEAICLIIPVDPILILYCTEKRSSAIWYGILATIASVIGGIVGYFIGSLLWGSIGMKLIHALSSINTFEKICSQYKQYEYWAVLIAGFSPFPYKAVTLSAGFCRLPLIPFIICSIIGRGARFLLIAGLIKIYGEQIKEYIDRYFNQLVVLFTLIIIISFLLLR